MAHDVFISYATEDETTADVVCAELEKEGIRSRLAITINSMLPEKTNQDNLQVAETNFKRKSTTQKKNKAVVIGICLGVILLITLLAIFEFDRTPSQTDDLTPRSALTSQVIASIPTQIPPSQTANHFVFWQCHQN